MFEKPENKKQTYDSHSTQALYCHKFVVLFVFLENKILHPESMTLRALKIEEYKKLCTCSINNCYKILNTTLTNSLFHYPRTHIPLLYLLDIDKVKHHV